MKINYKTIFGFLGFIVMFVGLSYYLQNNMQLAEKYISLGLYGILLYIFIAAFATIFAPLSALPLLPVAVQFYGWRLAAFYSLIGWVIGAIVAFYIARSLGVKILEKLVSLDKIHEYEKIIPKKDIFLSIIILRIILPSDIVSYAIGLLSKVDFKTYFFATIIGMIPFAIILSYIGSKSPLVQILSLIIGGIFFLGLYYKISLKFKSK